MTRFSRLVAVAALAFPLALSAQPASGERGTRHIDRLTERLDLTDSQVAMLKTSMEGERSRGASWELAARLAPTLSDAQLAALTAPRERGERGARGERGQRGEAASGERAERREERAEQRRERRAESDAARDAALGLSAQQKSALEAARTERQASRGGVPAEMAEVLTDEQEAVLLVHRALSGSRGRGGRGGDGGRRGGRR